MLLYQGSNGPQTVELESWHYGISMTENFTFAVSLFAFGKRFQLDSF